MSKHAELPWTITVEPCENEPADIYVGIPDRRRKKGCYSLKYAAKHVCKVYNDNGQECVANAEFICRACNSHYDMLAALEDIERIANELSGHTTPLKVIAKMAHQALIQVYEKKMDNELLRALKEVTNELSPLVTNDRQAAIVADALSAIAKAERKDDET